MSEQLESYQNKNGSIISFNEILNKTEETSLDEKLKTCIVGGYTKGSVERYIKSLEDSIEQMKYNLERQINDLVLEKENLSKEHALLKVQLSKIESRAEDLQNGAYILKDENERLSAEIENKKLSFENERERLNSEYELLQNNALSNENELNSLKDGLNEKQVLLEQLSSNLSNVKNELSKAYEKISENENTKDVIRNKLSIKEKKLEDTCKLLEQKEAELEDYRNKLFLKESELEGYRNKLSNKENELVETGNQLDEMKFKLNDYRNKLAELSDINSNKTVDLNRKKDELVVRETKLNETNDILNLKEADLTKRENELSNFSERLAEKEASLARLEKQLSVKEIDIQEDYNKNELENEYICKRLEALQSSLSTVNSGKIVVKNQSEFGGDNANEFTGPRYGAGNKSSKLSNIINLMEDQEVDSCVRDLIDELKQEKDELISIIRSLKLKIDNSDLVTNNYSYETLNEEYAQLQNQYVELQKQYDNLKNNNNVLNDCIKKYKLKEHEYTLMEKNIDFYRNKVSELEQEIANMLSRMETQNTAYKNVMTRFDEDQNRIRELIRRREIGSSPIIKRENLSR